MVKVQPLVVIEGAVEDFLVVDGGEGNVGVGEHHGYGIVPGLGTWRRIDCDLGDFLKFDSVGVFCRALKGFHDGEQDAFGGAFVGYTAFDGFANDVLICVEDGKGAAAVVQKPMAVVALLNGGIHQAIGAKVVALVALVHRHEDLGVQELDRENE